MTWLDLSNDLTCVCFESHHSDLRLACDLLSTLGVTVQIWPFFISELCMSVCSKYWRWTEHCAVLTCSSRPLTLCRWVRSLVLSVRSTSLKLHRSLSASRRASSRWLTRLSHKVWDCSISASCVYSNTHTQKILEKKGWFPSLMVLFLSLYREWYFPIQWMCDGSHLCSAFCPAIRMQWGFLKECSHKFKSGKYLP